MRRFFSYGVALAIIAVIAFWMSSGVILRGGNGPGEGETPIVSLFQGDAESGEDMHATEDMADMETHEGGEEEVDPFLTIAERNELHDAQSDALQSVRIAEFVAQMKTIEVPLRGRTEAKASVAAVAQTSGSVEEVLVEKGQQVAEGDLLCRLDAGTREAAVAQAEATVAQSEAALVQAQANYDNNAVLRERGVAPANSAQSVEVALRSAQANLRAAQAGLDQAEAELDRIEIYAKAGGVVQDPLASVGEMMSMGSVCANVVQLDPIVFVSSVPEARIGLARQDLPVTVTTITGDTAEGTVSFIAATADEATHTFRIEVDIPNPDGKLRGGLTADGVVTIGTIPAQQLPQSVLTLDAEGTLGARTVEDGIVKFYPIQIVSDGTDGIWVTGLPTTADVITLGQEDVVEGQAVDAGRVEPETAS